MIHLWSFATPITQPCSQISCSVWEIDFISTGLYNHWWISVRMLYSNVFVAQSQSLRWKHSRSAWFMAAVDIEQLHLTSSLAEQTTAHCVPSSPTHQNRTNHFFLFCFLLARCRTFRVVRSQSETPPGPESTMWCAQNLIYESTNSTQTKPSPFIASTCQTGEPFMPFGLY